MDGCLTQLEFEDLTAGTLPEDEKDRAGVHLERCESCRERLESSRRDAELLVQIREAHAPSSAGGALPAGLEFLAPLREAESGRGEGPRLGDFRLIRELGRGGMGVVFLAEQFSLRRHVALKVLPGRLLLSPRDVERFHREATAAARLRHPNIVAVHTVGEERGVHFFAMDYVRGPSLAEVIERMRREPEDPAAPLTRWAQALERAGPGSIPAPARSAVAVAAGIGLRVAEALSHAHAHGVIHRDIKPSNILLDDCGKPFVVDFGLAKEVGSESLSRTGDVLGTLAYMSPERANGRHADHRTDIYSLGVTLYELLTLRAPFRAGSTQQLLREIAEREPTRLRRWNPRVPRDLETIVLAAMEKAPSRRYQGAAEMARDLAGFLEHRPIQARPIGFSRRSARLLRRHPAATLAVAFAVLLVVVGPLAFALQQAVLRRRAEESRADAHLERAQRVLAEGAHQEAALLAAAALELKETPLGRGTLYRALDERQISPAWASAHGDAVRAAVSPDSSVVVSSSRDGTVKVWETSSGREVAQLDLRGRAIRCLDFSADGSVVAFGVRGHGPGKSGGTWLWNVPRPGVDGSIVETPPPRLLVPGRAASALSEVNAVAFGSDGKHLAAAAHQGNVFLWDAGSGAHQHSFEVGGSPRSLAFSQDCSLLAAGSNDGTIRVWDVALRSPTFTLRGHEGVVNAVAFSPQGLLASGARDGTVRLWDVAAGQQIALLDAQAIQVLCVAFTPDGELVAAAGADTAVRVWEVAARQRVAILQGHRAEVLSLAFSADGRWLISGSWDRTVRVWALERVPRRRLRTPMLRALAVSGRGEWLAAGCESTVRVWDLRSGSERTLLRHDKHVNSVAVSGDGALLASASADRTIRLLRLGSDTESAVLAGHGERVNGIAFNPDDTLLASASWDRTIRLWDAASGKSLRVLTGHTDRVQAVAFSPVGQLLASGSNDGTVRLWDPEGGGELRRYAGAGVVHAVAFSPDGEKVAAGSEDGRIHVWRTERTTDGATAVVLRGHTELVGGVAFALGGRLLASVSWDSTLRFWDVARAEEVATVLGHGGRAYALALDRSGTLLATGGADSLVRLRDLRLLERLLSTPRQDLRGLAEWETGLGFEGFGPP